MAGKRRTDGFSGAMEKRYWDEADARAVIKTWQRSGKPVSVFAREHGLVPQRIWRWASRLQRQGKNGRLHFHAVRVVEAVGGGGLGSAIEVVLVDGRRVRVPPGFAAEELERVLSVLEGGARC